MEAVGVGLVVPNMCAAAVEEEVVEVVVEVLQEVLVVWVTSAMVVLVVRV